MKWRNVLLILIFVGNASAADTILTDKWVFNTTGSVMHAYPLNLNDNPSMEVVVDSVVLTSFGSGGKIFGLDWDGTELWHYNMRGSITGLAVSDFKDDKGEILAGALTGAVSLNRDKSANWRYSAARTNVVSVFLEDLDGNGRGDAVLGTTSWSGNSVLIFNDAGEQVGKLGLQKFLYPYATAASDLDGDGVKEVAVGFTGFSRNTVSESYDLGFTRPSTVKVMNLSGDEIWSFATVGGVRSLAAADVTGNGLKEFIVGSNRRVYLVDRRGKQLWDYSTKDLVYDVAAEDLDGDGKMEVIVASDSIYVFKSDGSLFWNSKKYQGVYALETADLDDDGVPEVLAGTTRILVYDNKGNLLWSSADMRQVADITYTDLDVDGYLEVLVSATDGTLRVFDSEPFAKRKKAAKFMSEAKKAYNSGDYKGTKEAGLAAKKLYYEVAELGKSNEADALVDKAASHEEADLYYNDSVTAFEDSDYERSGELASRASAIYSEIKDNLAMADALKIYEASEFLPAAKGNYSVALELEKAEEYVNASEHARRALNAYSRLNYSLLYSETEELVVRLEKYAEGEEYYLTAQKLYTQNEFSNASVHLERAKEIYTELSYGKGLVRVEDLKEKISDTGTLKRMFLVGGVGLVVILLIGVILIALVLYLLVSKKKKKEGLSDLNQEST